MEVKKLDKVPNGDMSEICLNDDKVFTSMSALSEHLGIDKQLLKIAKRMGAPGFTVSGRVYWEQLEPWFNEHRAELEDASEDQMTKWRTRKLKAEALTAEIELEEMRDKYLNKDEVKAFLKQISSAQMAVLKSKLTGELPPKLLGLNAIDIELQLTQVLNEVCGIFQKKIDAWK